MMEEYVSFEIAELLKEKGFYQNYYYYPVYWMNGSTPTLSFEGDADFPFGDNECCAPSQAVAMRWLREFHHYIIEIHYGNVGSPREPKMQWWWELENIQGEFLDGNITGGNTTYEEAAEAAIKYCLENLI